MDKRHAYFASELKTRAEADGDKYIEGYFAVFNQETNLWCDEYERIAPGAFATSLANNDIRCLFNHDTGFVLGRMASDTLELREDAHGLWGRVKINPDDSQAMNIYARVQRGDISGCSFGFFPLNEEWADRPDGGTLWTVKEADTHEVSICTFPAYPQTEIQARQADFKQHKERTLKQRKAELKLKLEAMKCSEK
ncbi:MAG: HK97 family phage prohead protease [Oscillospiraceae bacterium]|nr:HK97 family phage prohead protease [Oscillospiraceae bacterium]